MPLDQDPQHIAAYPYMASVQGTTGVQLQVTFYDDGQQAPGYLDQVLQEVVDLLQSWTGRGEGIDAVGQKFDLLAYQDRPTFPVPPPPPPEVDPNDPGGGTGE